MTYYKGIGEGNGNLLQYSCLENTVDREAWWSVVYGVAPSWTQLKRLSSSSRVPFTLTFMQFTYDTIIYFLSQKNKKP